MDNFADSRGGGERGLARTAWLLTLATCLQAASARGQPEPGTLPPGRDAPATVPVAPDQHPESPAEPSSAPPPARSPATPEPAPVASPEPTPVAAPEPSSADLLSTTTPPVEIHGFVSQGFIKSTANNYLVQSKRGSFEFSEVGVNFTANPLDNLRIGAQLFAHDLGPLGNYRTRFDWFYLDYRFRDWLGLRAGRTKIPFGLYNETNDVDAGRVPILLPQGVYPIQTRDFLLAQTGGELYGTLRLGDAGAVEYRGYGGTLYIDPADTQNVLVNPTVPYLVGGRLMWQAPFEGLQAGGSIQALRIDGGFAPSGAELTRLTAMGALPAGFSGTASIRVRALLGIASVEYAAHDLLLASEYSRWRLRSESDVPGLAPKEPTVSERLYFMGSYRFAPWFVPGLYYSFLRADVDQGKKAGNYQSDVAGTLRFDINTHWLVKLEGHYMHGTAGLTSSLNGDAQLGSLTTNWGVLLIKTTAYF